MIINAIIDIWNVILNFFTSTMNTCSQASVVDLKDFLDTNGLSDFAESASTALQITASSLLVIFFLYGFLRTGLTSHDIRLQTVFFQIFRFVIAKEILVRSYDILLSISSVAKNITDTVAQSVGGTSGATLHSLQIRLLPRLEYLLETSGFWSKLLLYLVSIICLLIVAGTCIVIVLTAYTRFFKLVVYACISPLALSTMASEQTRPIGINFIKSFIGVSLQGLVILINCRLFSKYMTYKSAFGGLDFISFGADGLAGTFGAMLNMIFCIILAATSIKASDRLIEKILG